MDLAYAGRRRDLLSAAFQCQLDVAFHARSCGRGEKSKRFEGCRRTADPSWAFTRFHLPRPGLLLSAVPYVVPWRVVSHHERRLVTVVLANPVRRDPVPRATTRLAHSEITNFAYPTLAKPFLSV